jgi:HTH-type transcriptional regulator/antitoxin MqsA
MTITYKGHKAIFDMPGWYCEGRDEGLHTGDDMKISDRALNRLKAQIEGLLEPEVVRRIRKRLHLTQKDAGRLIGGGPNAFQKYESGDVVVSHAVTSALLLLDRDPSGLSVLRARADPTVASSAKPPVPEKRAGLG